MLLRTTDPRTRVRVPLALSRRALEQLPAGSYCALPYVIVVCRPALDSAVSLLVRNAIDICVPM